MALFMRSIEEWIGATDDSRIPNRVRSRLLLRSGGRCERCISRIVVGRWNADHRQAIINGGENRESNLQVLCLNCHTVKTKADVAEKSKINRIRLKHIGVKSKKKKMGYRRFDGTVVPPRYE